MQHRARAGCACSMRGANAVCALPTACSLSRTCACVRACVTVKLCVVRWCPSCALAALCLRVVTRAGGHGHAGRGEATRPCPSSSTPWCAPAERGRPWARHRAWQVWGPDARLVLAQKDLVGNHTRIAPPPHSPTLSRANTRYTYSWWRRDLGPPRLGTRGPLGLPPPLWSGSEVLLLPLLASVRRALCAQVLLHEDDVVLPSGTRHWFTQRRFRRCVCWGRP